MRSMLAAPDVRVVGDAGTTDDVLRLVTRTAPELVLMGCYPLPSTDCHEVLKTIKARSPRVSVIIMTGSERTIDLSRAMQLGCSGYLKPTVTAQELLKALRAIARGECIIDSQLLRRLFSEMAKQRSVEKMPEDRLSRQEQDVLRLITEGETNREIADELGYKPATVKDYVQRIIQKLQVSDRTQAAVKAVRTGLVT